MATSITKSAAQAALNSIMADAFPGTKNVIVQDDGIPVDDVTPFTDALAAYATLINPKKGYPGQPK